MTGHVLGPMASGLPRDRQALPIARDFSPDEYGRLRSTLFDRVDGFWIGIYEEPWLYFFTWMRKHCVFAARLEPRGGRARVAEAWVTRDPPALQEVDVATMMGGFDVEANAVSLRWLLHVITDPTAETELSEDLGKQARAGAVEPFAKTALEALERTGGTGPLWERAAALGRSIDPNNRLYAVDLAGAERFYPPLEFWARVCAIPFLGVFVLLAVVIACLELLFGEGSLAFLLTNLGQMLVVFGGLGIGLMGLAYLSGRSSAWSVEESGLRGRTLWGRRSFIPWEDVGRVRGVLVESTNDHFWTPPVRGFRVVSRTTGVEILGWTSGINVWDAHNQLCRRAGAGHMLTKWFRAKHFAPEPK